MKIFLYGGTFDPVHNGHEKIIDKILHLCDKLLIIPTNKSPHKSSNPFASSEHRYAMLKLLFESNKKIDILTYELDKKKPAFTYDTINFVKLKYNSSDLTFVVGYDLINTLSGWYNIDKIIKDVEFMAFHRPDYDFIQKDDCNIRLIENFNEDISSSEIRNLINQGKYDMVKTMISKLIYDYILNKKLYKC